MDINKLLEMTDDELTRWLAMKSDDFREGFFMGNALAHRQNRKISDAVFGDSDDG